jgi:hypothetical protein
MRNETAAAIYDFRISLSLSLSEALCGIVGNRSDRLFYEKWLILKQNLATLTPDANQELLRAVNRAYLQATLQVQNESQRLYTLTRDVDLLPSPCRYVELQVG